MQIHNHAANADQTLFALNNFGRGFGFNAYDLGIGNSDGTHPDWTFAGNSGQYSVKTLDVWVNGQTTVPEPTSFAIFGIMGLTACGVRRRRSKRTA